ncbi:hypothetical protein DWZ36_13700 [Phocaeicola vulgatus]|nr:hypothetical protein DWZ36_13700 [Phocaeicola vulgatus]
MYQLYTRKGIKRFCVIKLNNIQRYNSMDILSLTKVTSSFILTLIERDDGQKKQILETPTNGSCV